MLLVFLSVLFDTLDYRLFMEDTYNFSTIAFIAHTIDAQT